MSSAFVRETDDQWLNDVRPSLTALINFLTRENNGVPVNLLKTESDKDGRELYFMSNGLAYWKSSSGTWNILE
jgi:hypothetical protein